MPFLYSEVQDGNMAYLSNFIVSFLKYYFSKLKMTAFYTTVKLCDFTTAGANTTNICNNYITVLHY